MRNMILKQKMRRGNERGEESVLPWEKKKNLLHINSLDHRQMALSLLLLLKKGRGREGKETEGVMIKLRN